jgi:hypothetical protein
MTMDQCKISQNYRKKRAVGMAKRLKLKENTRTVRVSERVFAPIGYEAGLHGETFSRALTRALETGQHQYSLNSPMEARFAGVCARLYRAILDHDPNMAAAAAAEAVLFGAADPDDTILGLAEAAATLFSNVADIGWKVLDQVLIDDLPKEERPKEERPKVRGLRIGL